MTDPTTYIRQRLAAGQTIRRMDLVKALGMPSHKATAAIKAFMQAHPGEMVYDTGLHAYRAETRRAMHPSEISKEDLAAIAGAEYPKGFEHLDEEMASPTEAARKAALDWIASKKKENSALYNPADKDHWSTKYQAILETIETALHQPPTIPLKWLAPVAHFFEGDPVKTLDWFHTPNPQLGGVTPMESRPEAVDRLIEGMGG